MPYPHVIRLRGPWEYEVVSCGDSASDMRTGRTTLPGDWAAELGSDFRGRVRYRRRFNRPSGLDPHERVWLVAEGVDAFGAAALNGRALGEIRGYALPASFDVTELLTPSNELQLDVELPGEGADGPAAIRPGREAEPGGPIGEVRLEVRASAFIERLAIWTSREHGAVQLHVGGHVCGDASGPLAIVVNGLERELLYGDVQAGAPFELSDWVEGLPCWPPATQSDGAARLEIKLLAGGAALWQSAREIAVAEAPASHSGLRQIFPEATYAGFDRSGTAIVQAVPLAWAEEVCPRLAHHPCIIAWAASAAELAEAGEAQLKRLAFGRPWLASEGL